MSGLRSMLKNEDWMSLWVGLLIVAISMVLLLGPDLLGWAVKTNVWTSPGEALQPVSAGYAGLSGGLSLLLTYVFMLLLMTAAARFLEADIPRFVVGFTIIFIISYICWFLGHYAYIAATPDTLESLGIGWSMNLTGEAGYILALLVGLVVGNFFPRLVGRIDEATKPELFIKIAIVIMGLGLGVRAVEAFGLA